MAKRTLRRNKVARLFALTGLLLMLVFLMTGAASPEPSDHPAWIIAMLDKPIAGSVIQAVVYMCWPAYMIAEFVPSSEVVFWCVSCLMQIAIYYGLGYAFGAVVDLSNRIKHTALAGGGDAFGYTDPVKRGDESR